MANFYSEEMINKLVDDGEIENIIPKIDELYNNIFDLLYMYSHLTISPGYIACLLMDNTNKIVFRCIDTEFRIENCPSILIYRKNYNRQTKEMTYYILMICTKQKFKKFGYASKMLDDFIQYIKNKHVENRSAFTNIKIVLSSVETAVTFYESYGFRWTREDLTAHKTLMRYEKYESDKEYFIMELCI